MVSPYNIYLKIIKVQWSSVHNEDASREGSSKIDTRDHVGGLAHTFALLSSQPTPSAPGTNSLFLMQNDCCQKNKSNGEQIHKKQYNHTKDKNNKRPSFSWITTRLGPTLTTFCFFRLHWFIMCFIFKMKGWGRVYLGVFVHRYAYYCVLRVHCWLSWAYALWPLPHVVHCVRWVNYVCGGSILSALDLEVKVDEENNVVKIHKILYFGFG